MHGAIIKIINVFSTFVKIFIDMSAARFARYSEILNALTVECNVWVKSRKSLI
jgi:hypothetical protein